MKAFIVAALFVAAVAGQNLDLYKYRMDRTHDLTTMDDDLLLKEKLGRHFVDRDTLFNTRDLDLTTILGRDTTFGRHTILSLDEIMVHPLFRVYMNIPLFRKFMIEHPVVFRKYVTCPLFQKFWTVPRFQMYFWNPVLFYKYIVPQLHFIHRMVVSEGVYNIDDMTTMKRFVPYVYKYNKDMTFPTMTMDKVFNTLPHHTDFRYLLEKMMKHMDIDMVRDVTVDKMVDPITGEIKVVDDRVLPVLKTLPFGINKFVGHRDLVKDLLLKKIILTKIFGDRTVLSHDIYDILFREHKEMIPEVYKYLFNLKDIITPDVLYTLFNTKKFFIPEVYESLFNIEKVLHPTLFDIFYKDLVTKKFFTREIFDILFKGHKDIVTPEILETVFGKKIYNDVVLRTLFGDKVVLPEVYRYDNDFVADKRVMYNPIFNRMFMNKRLTTDKVFDTIEKERMIKDLLLKNRDIVDTDKIIY